MNANEINGRHLALLLVGETENGEEDCAVFTGTICFDNSRIFLHFEEFPPFEIRPEWLERVKPVSLDLKDIFLGAEFYIPLSIGPLPDDVSPEDCVPTGLKWPE